MYNIFFHTIFKKCFKILKRTRKEEHCEQLSVTLRATGSKKRTARSGRLFYVDCSFTR